MVRFSHVTPLTYQKLGYKIMMGKKTWHEFLGAEKKQEYFKKILIFINNRIDLGYTVYPKKNDIFNALKLTAYDSVKIIIIGQDPYHGFNQAHGLSFSVPEGIKIPPSLNNIFKELNSDLGIKVPKSGSLIKWAQKGVLLLNSILTVEENKPQSHAEIGWESFTDQIIKSLNYHDNQLVFMLWGNFAKKKSSLISKKHKILMASHPSPLSAHNGFFGCNHFSQANAFLKKTGNKEVDWSL